MVQAIKRGDNPVQVLIQLKAEMQEKISAAGHSPDPELKVEFAGEALEAHSLIMSNLSKIYQSGSVRVEQLKDDIRQLYEKARNQVDRYSDQLRAAEQRAAEQRAAEQQNLIHHSVVEIDALIDRFEKKVENIDFGEARNTANVLLGKLIEYKNTYAQDAKSNPKSAAEKFIQNATDAIHDAKPVLERDLGWGDYLTNLAKQLANAVTKGIAAAVTLGTSSHNGFFTPKRSATVEAAEDLEQGITQTPLHGQGA